jgi:fimbrial chaperone protein
MSREGNIETNEVEMLLSKSAFVAAFVAVVVALPGVAQAMGISPVQLELQSAGSTSRSMLTVDNKSGAPLPVEITIKRMTQDENGTRKYHPDGANEFLILPPQAMIPPGGSQVFRVQWVGEPQLDQSKSYMFFANQVPVKLPTNTSGVQMVTSMGAMINVAPPQSQGDLKLVSTGIEIDKKSGKRHPTLTVENPTKTHALLPKAAIKLQAGGWQESYAPDSLLSQIGIGLVPPGQRRKFVLPAVLPQGVTSVQASLQYGVKR